MSRDQNRGYSYGWLWCPVRWFPSARADLLQRSAGNVVEGLPAIEAEQHQDPDKGIKLFFTGLKSLRRMESLAP